MKAHNIALVMHRNIEDPPMSTIWGRIELPVLQAGNPGGVVDYITAVDAEDINRWKVAWRRIIPVGRLIDDAEMFVQKALFARELEGSAEGMEKRDGFDACPVSVDESHPLW